MLHRHTAWKPRPRTLLGSSALLLIILVGLPTLMPSPQDWQNLRQGEEIRPSYRIVTSNTPPPPACLNPTVNFAVIGDYGSAGSNELAVANQVESWNPDFIITTGDNNYPDGAAATIDTNIGQYYYAYIGGYQGSYGSGPDLNRPTNFYPALGNHDWHTREGDPPLPKPYLDYFDLPGNERYYQFVRGPVAFFAINSSEYEPDGNSSSSVQAGWLQAALGASSEPWKLVYMHHAPYSSSSAHGSSARQQWPYREWGADVVLSGHDHTYERILVDGLPYFVNGLGGSSIYDFGLPIAGSQVRYNGNYGAMRITANQACITFEFVAVTGEVRDRTSLVRSIIYLPIVRQAS